MNWRNVSRSVHEYIFDIDFPKHFSPRSQHTEPWSDLQEKLFSTRASDGEWQVRLAVWKTVLLVTFHFLVIKLPSRMMRRMFRRFSSHPPMSKVSLETKKAGEVIKNSTTRKTFIESMSEKNASSFEPIPTHKKLPQNTAENASVQMGKNAFFLCAALLSLFRPAFRPPTGVPPTGKIQRKPQTQPKTDTHNATVTNTTRPRRIFCVSVRCVWKIADRHKRFRLIGRKDLEKLFMA